MSAVHSERIGAVARLTIDDGKANALSAELIDALDSSLVEARAAGAKAVVLRGRPGRFSAGFDLKVMRSGPDAAVALVAHGARFLMDLLLFPLPVVGACTGHAIAAGALTLAACDRRIGVRGETAIGLNEIAAGMPVPIFAHELARARLDPRALTDAVLTSRLYPPEEAAAVGWRDRVVDSLEALDREASAEAERLAELPGGPFAQTKRSLRGPLVEHVRATLEANLAEFGIGGAS
ncbi:MAG: crotonase/enoyl-CoA hydratase family protein [Sandaracinaceae bacterium]